MSQSEVNFYEEHFYFWFNLLHDSFMAERNARVDLELVRTEQQRLN